MAKTTGRGIVIFTRDERPFLVGKYHVMHKNVDAELSDPDTTFILHTHSFTAKQVEEWLPYIGNRLVVVINKAPRLNKKIEDRVIIDQSLKIKDDELLPAVHAILMWSDRRKVWQKIKGWMPIPYALAFLRANVDDSKFWRLVAKANMQMDDDIVRAVFAYGIVGKRSKIKWPKKQKQEELPPAPFRHNDKYWREIVTTFIPATNEVRDKGNVPAGIKKRKEKVNEWL